MSEVKRLHPDCLSELPDAIQLPTYQRSAVKQGIVHLGTGAFHRAHQAAIFESCLEAGDLRWGITGSSLRSPAVAEQINPQAGLYTLSVSDRSGTHDKVIGAINQVIVARDDPSRLVKAIASHDVHLVTLTITEKGYMLDPADGSLLTTNAEVAHDCGGPEDPLTGPGYLAKALELRKASGAPPLTILSCDNLPHNGERLRDAVCGIAAGWDGALADWIAREVAFPQTMIDRIVPATTQEDIDALSLRAGYVDLGMVKTEPFLQWVVEDSFAGERPDLANAGVQLTSSVDEWEKAKLRLLNGSHSTLAYLGALAGIDFIHEVVARPAARQLVSQLWEEAAATLSPPSDLNINRYCVELLKRFDNPALPHRTRQIAMDGSQKLPQRLLETIAKLYENGTPPKAALMGVAAWMQWVTGGSDDRGSPIHVDDPMAQRFADIAVQNPVVEERVSALLAVREIFPPELASNTRFRESLVPLVANLSDRGSTKLLA